MGPPANWQLPPRPPYFAAVFRGLLLRCPRCGVGRMSDGILKRKPYCTQCGQSFALDPGEFTGGAYIGYGLSVVLLFVLFVLLIGPFHMDVMGTLWVLIPASVILPVLLQRHSVGAFTGVLIASGAMDRGPSP